MKDYLKIIIVYIARLGLKAFRIFPVNRKKILFSAYEGMQYTCSPKYIFEYIEKNGDKGLEFVWCLNNPALLPEQYRGKVKTVRFLSLQHLYHLMTSGTIISNLGIEPFLPKRKNQTFINTWHGGGAYKRVKYNLSIFSKAHARYSKVMRSLRSKSTDVFLASCAKFAEISSEDFAVSRDRFVPSGMPRNDYLYNTDPERVSRLRAELAERYGIDNDALWVLYAPTFRGSFRNQQQLDNAMVRPEVRDAFEKRFGKKMILLNRAHVSKNHSNDALGTIGTDVSDYQDMQLLLEACDVLITDYSSSMWDFALTGKPGFLYVPDLKEYLDSVGFYTPISTWAHPYAENLEDFCRLIQDYDNNIAKKKIENHLNSLGSYEHGKASEIVLDLINNSLK